MARLIDADALIEAMDLQNCKKYGNETPEEMSDSYGLMPRYEIKAMIDDAPTVDAVEVVRCGECVHRWMCALEEDGFFCKMGRIDDENHNQRF